MPFDTSTRNRLAGFVKDARDLITAEFTQQFSELYGIAADGTLTPVAQLTHLDENGLATAALLRERIAYLIRTHPEERGGPAVAVTRLAREQAFTVLNRLAAVRMAEKRGLILPSVGKGYQSDGFRIYDTVAGNGLGDAYHRYRRYLFCLFDELAIELGVLFNRHAPQGLLFPQQTALLTLLDLLNAHDLEALWAEDETIGWIYQYYNDPEERRQMRADSPAPRNSRELAVRNQFFTPRYVVEFLTDNTLGRIWYEMCGGRTSLKAKCRYLVRRPTEIFLAGPAEVYQHLFGKQAEALDMQPSGWAAEAFAGQLKNLPEKASDPDTRWVGSAIRPADFEQLAGEPCQPFEEHRLHRLSKAILDGRETEDTKNLVLVWATLSDFNRCDGSRGYSAPHWEKLWAHFRKLASQTTSENLSQEELFKKPVFIPFRPLKDPRTILMLDPACGSMHFGLYAFDLYEVIYAEAWDLEEVGTAVLSRPPGMKSLHESYADKPSFLRDVPKLIIEHNIHGIDIDPRCAQIAGLSLWLRAQRAWKDTGLKPAERPVIKRSNIVCAEPMPGEKTQLKEFCDSLKQPVIGQMVEVIFDKMSLAGEAGSLLKIEEEIRDLVHNTKLKWTETYRFDQAKEELFSKAEIAAVSKAKKSDGAELNIDFSGITDESFWEKAEDRIYTALRDYAEQAESGGGFQRRLFAEDAARGFAFIDLCRKRYDVVVMNPPFGKATGLAEKYLREYYEEVWTDIYGCFLWRFFGKQSSVGCISSSLFLYTKQMRELRRMWIDRKSLHYLIELGGGVLDGATVETALTVSLTRPAELTCFLDLTDEDHKAVPVVHFARFEPSPSIPKLIPLDSFAGIYLHPFCYHLDPAKLALWSQKERIDPEFGTVTVGNNTFDDFRFQRLRWEVCPDLIGSNWFGYEEGGEYQPYSSPTPVLYNWAKDGEEARSFQIHKFGTDAQVKQSISWWWKAGLTYPRVSSIGFGPRVLPCGHVFSGDSISIFAKKETDLLPLLGFLTSTWAQDLSYAFGRYRKIEARAISNLPIARSQLESVRAELTALAIQGFGEVAKLERGNEVSPFFVLPFSCFLRSSQPNKVARNEFSRALRLIADKADLVVGRMLFGQSNRPPFSAKLRSQLIERFTERDSENESDATNLFSLSVGAVIGRWDIRYAMGENAAPDLPDPFAPLPVCPPCQLQNTQGLPARPEDVPADYPIKNIPWHGILVDDEHHPDDLEARVHEVLKVIWKDQWESIEREACQMLGVESLRDYFRKPTGFFADHLSRYSKSPRQAPIYWPLSTKSGSYTLWIYYHRLNDQTLHTALADFVVPKIRDINKALEGARAKNLGGEASDLADLLDELNEFRAELEHLIKLPWKPNLNDGVLINASPLWKLFRFNKWQSTLKSCWEELEAEDYDWAHLAYTIWPDRVREKCKTDRSLAIAHGLEELCEVKAPEKKAKKGKKKKEAELKLEGD